MRACFNGKLIDQISSQDVERYKKMRVGEGVTLSIVNKSLQIQSRMFFPAIEWEYLRHNPCTGVNKFSEVQYRRKRVLSRIEERRLFEAIIPGHLRSMIRIFINTGLRRQELFKIMWNDVDFRTGSSIFERRRQNGAGTCL